MIGDFGEVYLMDWGLAKVLTGEGEVPVAAMAPVATVVPGPTVAAPAAVPLPGNVGVPATANSKVVVHRGPDPDLTEDGAILGTPAYMPPEQAIGRLDDIDPRSDIYSLGAILYETLTLAPPIDREGGYMAMLMRVSQGEIAPPEQRAPDRARQGRIPRELAAIAMKALARRPADRYPGAEALRRDIERFQEGRSVSAKEDTYREAAWKLVKRNKAASLAAAVALLVLVCSVAFSFNAWRKAVRANEEFAQAQKEKREQALKAVPAIVESARLSLSVDRRKLDSSLAQINLALDYDPDNAEARLLKGQVQIVLGDFAAARAELQEYLRQKPKDAEARRLAELCATARRDDVPTLLAFAEVFMKQNAPGLADSLLSKYGPTSQQARARLFDLYRKRIEAAWQGRGQWLNHDPNGIYELYMNGVTQLTDLAPLREIPLTKLYLGRCSQLRDLGPLHGMQLKYLSLEQCPQLRDLAPLRGMPLTWLNLQRCEQLSDLTPLRGLPLTHLDLGGCRRIHDFTPLQGLPLAELGLRSCDQIRELSPIKGLPLTRLDLWECKQVRDLTPLHGMKLNSLALGWTAVQDLKPLQGMPLTELTMHFCSQVRDLTPLANMKLTVLDMAGCSQVRDLSPLRGMRFTSLDVRFCSQVRDLSPLEGLSFTKLDLQGCSQVRDLSPLRDMPLTELNLTNCQQVFDLAPLQRLKLTTLNLNRCELVQDLAPLRGMPLTTLSLGGCRRVRDLTPLHHMPLTSLWLRDCGQLQDLAPLRGMKLTALDIRGCVHVRDLTPLAETTLAELYFTPRGITRGIEVLRQLKTLKTIAVDDTGRYPALEFWKRYDAGEFAK
jgi:tetratricopeptide (TPR) repeat protein